MAAIEERIDSKGKKSYRVKVRMKGFPIESATFNRLTDARKWASKIENDMRERRYFRYSEATRHTVGEMIDKYTNEVLPSKNARFQEERKYQLKFWKKNIGDYTLADANPAVIAEARDTLRNKPTKCDRQRSAGSVNRYMAALSGVYSLAVREWMWLEDNPMRKVTKLTEPRGRDRFLTDDERTKLLKACLESEEPLLYPLVVLALSTGARQGELLNLRWSEVDFEQGQIRLLETKNNERRSVPLVGKARELLEELSRVRLIDNDLVFPFENGKQGLRTPWEKTVEAAKIEDFRFHDLRHSAASALAMNGATLADIAEVLGHKTLQMVKRYAHLSEQHTSKVVARMNQKMFGE